MFIPPPQPEPDLDHQKKDIPASIPGNHICSTKSGFDPATVTPDKANKPITNKKPITIQQATLVSYQGIYCFLKNGGRSARIALGPFFYFKIVNTIYCIFSLDTQQYIG